MAKNYYLKKTCGIYCITHKETGKQYVGQSIDIMERWKQHSTPKKNASGIKGAIMKYGVDAFEFQVLEECKREELNEREIYWIAQLGTISPDGYNLTSGGEAPTTISEETGRKISESLKGKSRPAVPEERKLRISKGVKATMTDERRAEIGAQHRGMKKPHTKEHIEKIANAHKGMKRSEETRRKISEAAKRRGKNNKENSEL